MQVSQENQATIVWWAERTFGPAKSELRVATRVQEELVELSKAIQTGESYDKVCREAADVVICLYRLAAVLGGDLDRRAASAMTMGMAKELVPEGDSLERAVLRAETKLVVAKNMIADGFPKTRVLQEVTAVRVILEEVVMRLGANLTDEIDAKMAINRAREWTVDGSGHGYHTAEPIGLNA